MENDSFDGLVSPGIKKLWLRFYPQYNPNFFAERLEQNIRPSDHVLEIGAGSGEGNQMHFALRGKVARYVGIDPDPRVLQNRYLDEACVGRAESLPFGGASFDIVFHRFVAEHFESPFDCNGEIARVLRPGGVLLFQTPSRFYYPMLAARVTPHWFHEFYIGHFGSRRDPRTEVFPTFYRLNDDKSIKEQLRRCGFTCEIEHHSAPPGYLRFSRVSFLGGVLFERTLERRVPALRAHLIVAARKTV